MSYISSLDENRRVLPLSEWPEIDQAHWDRTFGPRHRPRRASDGGSLPKPVSIGMWQEACGRYQGYLQREGRPNPDLPLAVRATEDNLEGFYQHLLACGCSGHTILNYFAHLRAALKRMHPGQSFKFITHPGGIPL